MLAPRRLGGIKEGFAKVVTDEHYGRDAAAADSGILSRVEWDRNATLEVDRCERCGCVLSVAILEIDAFSELVDAHGPQAGEKALKTLALLASDAIRQYDSLRQFSADTYALLMPETTAGNAQLVVDRIREAFTIAALPVADGATVSRTVSAGIGQVEPSDSLEIVLARAN